jgi:hypothetical protein
MIIENLSISVVDTDQVGSASCYVHPGPGDPDPFQVFSQN